MMTSNATAAASGDGKLHSFLRRAYDIPLVSELIRTHLLARGFDLAGVVPQRAHLTKDARLIVGYRLKLFDTRGGMGLVELPAFLHDCSFSRASTMKTYRSLRDPTDNEKRTFPLWRHFLKTGPEEFLAAYPLDPEFTTLPRLLQPHKLLELLNSRPAEGADAIFPDRSARPTGLSTRLLGYRPERRVVLGVNLVEASGMEAGGVLKLYRRGDAERVNTATQHFARIPAAREIAVWPLSYEAGYGMIAYPLVPGEPLHDLLERGWGTAPVLERTGRLLREFHSLGEYLPHGDSLRQFTFAQELEILERWRRFLKQSGSPVHGRVAGYIRALESAAPRAPVPSALVHRDFYPKQIIVHPWTERQALIDIDTVAWGPPAVDLGNFLAHLALLESGDLSEFRAAFLKGYGMDTGDEGIALFEMASLLRLYCLAVVAPVHETVVERLSVTLRKQAAECGRRS